MDQGTHNPNPIVTPRESTGGEEGPVQERRLPTVADIVGLAPNFTGGVPSEEYVRQIRDGNNLPWPAEIERLRAENAMLREALKTVACGKFGAKRIPADTGDMFLALSIFVRQALETAQHTGSETDRKQEIDVCE